MSSFLAFTLLVAFLTLLTIVLRLAPAIPEPELPIKTPFGKLPFFDGVILYGFVILILLCVISQVLC